MRLEHLEGVFFSCICLIHLFIKYLSCLENLHVVGNLVPKRLNIELWDRNLQFFRGKIRFKDFKVWILELLNYS